MSFKTQSRRKEGVCQVCGQTANSGKKWCSLHHPKKDVRPHSDKYSAKQRADGAPA